MVNIVLIDDDEVSTFVTEKYIHKNIHSPYRIFKFSSAAAALEKIGEINPQYMFVDIVMPQMSGWDFLEQIDTEKLGSQIYILSGSMDRTDKEKARKHRNIKKFLSKLSVKESIPEIFRD
ncbi:Response regulator receiver domain-containing protein [Cyclobacterium lianum]|uniref:Response regulator receiver domain-containing protein n=1 Tax=Cyclobacterium lianum TaxID=388280 RepID=A0A1M7QF21_9BACT|nr:response regulator [Cyclobacterium lianum]SHN29546.1 Response regulator receiver domain-containing protein [Cyclobacterium lianum]